MAKSKPQYRTVTIDLRTSSNGERYYAAATDGAEVARFEEPIPMTLTLDPDAILFRKVRDREELVLNDEGEWVPEEFSATEAACIKGARHNAEPLRGWLRDNPNATFEEFMAQARRIRPDGSWSKGPRATSEATEDEVEEAMKDRAKLLELLRRSGTVVVPTK